VQKKNEFRLTRDRLGEEPLLYAPGDGEIAVGRTYEELFAGGVPKKWRSEALIDFLATGTCVFPGGRTFFEGVFEVPPGHDLIVSGGRTSVVEREALPEASEELGEEALPLLRELLTEALGDGLESAALCLSGGLDSSSLAAAWATRGTPRCFIYGPPGAPDRERALEVAESLGVEPVVLEPEGPAAIDELKELFRVLEIPAHIPGAPLPQFRLMRAMARAGTKTVFSGQGGDELFCGYPWHFPLAMNKLRRRDPETAERLEALHEERPPFGPVELRMTRRCFTRTSSWVTLNDGGACEVLGLAREEVAEREAVRFFAADLEEWDALRRHGLTGRSLRYLLHYDHRLASYFGVEGRAPLLSRGVVDLVSRFRLDFLYGGGFLKNPLRLLFPELPESVRFEARKTGFWHNGPSLPDLRDDVRRMFGTTLLGGLVARPEAVESMNPTALWRFFSAGTLLEDDVRKGA
jgi:asparagine synthetase B (glutamine-hydrolysing)